MSSTAAFLCVSGVGQVPGVSDGIGTLADALECVPGVQVLHYYWRKLHTGKVAEHAATLANAHVIDGAKVYVCGHSRGCQHGNDVCTELDELGVPVEGVYWADPWKKDGNIFVPKNVKEVHVWWKAGGLIKTAEIHAPHAQVAMGYKVELAHHRVDECEEFRAAIIAAVTKP